jgi:arylsulfatase
MLLTGTDNHIAGIGAMAGNEKQVKLRDVPGYEGYLNNKVVSISELLKDDEYFTVMTGKWHLGFEKDKIPVTRGFEKSWTLLPVSKISSLSKIMD